MCLFQSTSCQLVKLVHLEKDLRDANCYQTLDGIMILLNDLKDYNLVLKLIKFKALLAVYSTKCTFVTFICRNISAA